VQEKKDLRVIKTRNALYGALLELMKEKSFEEIRVSDICDKALVNRSTFYAHYTDKYELFLDFMNSIKTELAESLEKNENIINTKEYYIKMLSILLDHIEDKRNIFYSMVINNRNSIISDIIVDAINRDIKARLEDLHDIGGIPSEVVSVFYLGAVAGVCLLWIKNSNKYTKEEILEYLEKLIPENIGKSSN